MVESPFVGIGFRRSIQPIADSTLLPWSSVSHSWWLTPNLDKSAFVSRVIRGHEKYGFPAGALPGARPVAIRVSVHHSCLYGNSPRYFLFRSTYSGVVGKT